MNKENNKLPASWCVKNDGSDRVNKLVLGYLRKNYVGWKSKTYPSDAYFGIYRSYDGGLEDGYSWTLTGFSVLLTLDEFERLTSPPFVEPLIWADEDVRRAVQEKETGTKGSLVIDVELGRYLVMTDNWITNKDSLVSINSPDGVKHKIFTIDVRYEWANKTGKRWSVITLEDEELKVKRGDILYAHNKSYKTNNNNNMESSKQIKMSLETAQALWKENKTLNSTRIGLILEENFTLAELVGKKGFTWEDSFDNSGYFINTSVSQVQRVTCIKSDNSFMPSDKSLFRNEKQALSALAFAQLTYIVAKYNDGKSLNEFKRRYEILCTDEKLSVNVIPNRSAKSLLEFFNGEDAQTSLEVNNKLWCEYWMIPQTADWNSVK